MIQTMRRLGMPSVSLLTLLLVFGAIERPAGAQCTQNGTIHQFAPNGNPLGYGPAGQFKSGFATSIEMFSSGASRKLILHENFGYTIYDLSIPAAPTSSGAQDIESLKGTFAKVGDGFSTITAATASADGSRALVGTRTIPHGILNMKPNGSAFVFGGEFNPSAPNSLVVDQVGSRYLGYGLEGSQSTIPLTVADVTNFVPSPNDMKQNSIPGEQIVGAPGGRGLLRAGHYLIYSTGANVVVVDVSSPGPVGAISSNFGIRVFSPGDFGLPAADYVGDFAAAIHPKDGKLYIMVHSKSTVGRLPTSGVALGRTADGVNLTVVGPKLMLQGQWANSFPVGSGAIIPTSDDLLVMTWSYTDSASGSGNDNKLSTWAASGWGTDLTRDLVVASSSFMSGGISIFPVPSVMRGFASGNQVNTYIGTGEAGFSLSLTCSASLSSPASADLVVQTDPGNVTLADGASVFVGDKFKITPSVSPSPNTIPLTDWRFDYDFHVGTSEDNGTLPRIKFTDITGGATPPSMLSLVGPCDPSNLIANANPATGVGCWDSVTGSTFLDFPRVPVAGTSKTLMLALEAKNVNGSAGLKTFRLNFVVPRVKLKSSSFLSGASTPVIDGSEGSPLTSGYKWYFGGDPTAPVGETLTQDACTGATCNHAFAGKGVYNYFLSVPYANGYTTPDCAGPCTQTLGTVAITDVVLAFTAPSSVLKASNTFLVTSQSTKGNNVSDCAGTGGTGLVYNICDASGGSCNVAATSPFANGTASLTTPLPGNYTLRIRYNYLTPSSTCTAVDWAPNSVNGNSTVWPFVVSNVTPTIRMAVNGGDVKRCGNLGECDGFAGDSWVAYVYVGEDPDVSGGQTWSGPKANPASGSGATYSFTYTSQGTNTITLNAYGASVNQDINVARVPPPPPNPLSINSVNASPSNPTPGQSVTFSASASGGTGSISYSWVFSNGGSATGAAVAHVFANAGTYTGTVTAKTTGGDQTARVISVTVASPPPAYVDFQIKDDATGLLCQYSSAFGYGANSGQVLRFVPINAVGAVSWEFGDATSSIELSPAKTYTTAVDKVYSVKLVANGQTKQYTLEISGGLGPQLTGAYTYQYADGSTVNTALVTAGKAIRFTANDAADTFVWDFSDGSSLETKSPVDHIFNGSGTFKVVLSVTKAGLTPATSANPSSFTIPPPPEPDQWLVPGMAYSEGLGGASWQSDLSIYNPHSTQPMTISLAFLDGQVALTNPNLLPWHQYVLKQGQTITFVNVLKNSPFFLPKGKYGAILIRGDVLPAQPVFSSRTYNLGTGSGTYGLSMPAAAVSGGVHVGPQAPAAVAASRLIGLREDDGSYTNFGMANLKADYAYVEVKFFDAAGTQLGQPVLFNLAPYGVAQYNHVLSADPPIGAGYKDPVSTFVAAVRVISGTSVSPYATVIDKISSDPIFITPPTHPSASYRLPGIIRAQGNNGTLWRSGVVLYNPSASSRKVNLTYSYFSDTGVQARQTSSNSIDMNANQVLSTDDFVKTWLNLDESDTTNFAKSWVDVSPAPGDTNTDPLLILGHTYNNQPTGNVGLQVPGFTTDDGVSSLTAKKRLLMTGLTSSSAYRTNVAFFLVSQAAGGAAQANIKLLDGSGVVVKTVGISLDAYNAFVQMNDGALFGDIGGDKSNMSIVVDSVTGGSAIAGYATVIDQLSGDATLISAQPAP